MKKRFTAILLIILLCLSACSFKDGLTQETEHPDNPLYFTAPTAEPSGQPPELPAANVKITIGDQSFETELYDNASVRALRRLLPLTLSMQELNGNERYAYLTQTLPTAAQSPGYVHAGDLMLYGNNCLVLFYESGATSYRYTPLGTLRNIGGLTEALGTNAPVMIIEL